MPARKGLRLGAAPFLMDGEGGKARREEKGLTVPEMAAVQRWRVVRMGDERKGKDRGKPL